MNILPLAWRRSIRSFMAAGLMLFVADSASAQFVVSNTNDSGAGSLRQAITDANASGGTITFTTTGTINLTSASLPAITSNTTISGPGAGRLTVNGGNNFQVFTVNSGVVAISNLTVTVGSAVGGTGGAASGGGGGGGGLGAGGGLFVNSGAIVTIANVPFTGNKASGGAGGAGTTGVGAGGSGGGLNGGGGGTAGSAGSAGGPGGFGGGGGASIGEGPGGAGGTGGFGAGGGGGAASSGAGGNSASLGGLGGSAGSFGGGGGGGGAGLGGAIFVRQGGTLSIDGTTVSGSALSAGAAGGSAGGFGGPGQSGSTAGSGIFLNAVNVTFQGSNNATINDAIAGNGGLIKNGSGTTTLNAANTYTAPTGLLGGTLNVNGSIVSAITVNNSGTLMGNGSVGSTTVNGTIAPGNSIGTLTVNGSFVQNAGSRYRVELNAAGQSDLIRVNGTATINGGIIDVLAANGSYSVGQRWTILTATGGVTGRYSSVQDNLALFDFRDVYTANSVQLEAFLANSSSASQIMPLTFNQASFLNYLSGIGGKAGADLNFVVGQLQTLSNAQALHALDQMSGVQTANLLTLDRLRSLFLHALLTDEILSGLGGFSPYTFSARGQALDDDCSLGGIAHGTRT